MIPAAVLPCGAGLLGFGPCPAPADFVALKAWGASVLVTLMQDGEPGVAGLCEAARATGLDWTHAPIPDFGPPGPAFAAVWAGAGPMLARRLAAGGRVALHCRAGFGRSGTVAALMLIEHGATSAAALAAVRAARPGAVETVAQEAWLRARG